MKSISLAEVTRKHDEDNGGGDDADDDDDDDDTNGSQVTISVDDVIETCDDVTVVCVPTGAVETVPDISYTAARQRCQRKTT